VCWERGRKLLRLKREIASVRRVLLPTALPVKPATSMGGWAVSSGFESTCGEWGDAHNLYLGLQFVISGEAHFGWARISYHTGSMYLTGYAYETIANKPIAAGAESGDGAVLNEPVAFNNRRLASLGHLALGAEGLTAFSTRTDVGVESPSK
jgi:hypothetical protein